eukprot:NODE_109_length_19684_cov_0.566709.p5 type:complete len:384 gc:universal NODE_109_length_19684_cov_0.566709:18409-17258(-)
MQVEGRSKFQSVILGDELFIIGGTQPNIIKLNVNNGFSLNNVPYVFWRQLPINNPIFGCCVPSDNNEILCINNQSYFISNDKIDVKGGYESDGFNCLLYNDALLVYGGKQQQQVLKNMYLYTPRDQQWKQIQHSIPPLMDFTWTIVNNYAYMLGGATSNALANMNSIYKIDLTSLNIQLIQTANGPPDRVGHGACAMGEYIYLFGGYGNATLNDFWAFNTVSNIWTQLAINLPNRKYHHLMCIRRHVFIIFGSDDKDDQYTLYLYAPDRNISSLVSDYKPLGDSVNVTPPNFGRSSAVSSGLSIGAILGITLASLLVFVGIILCIWIRKKRDKISFHDSYNQSEEELDSHNDWNFNRQEPYKEPLSQFKVLNPDESRSVFSFK